jgi:nucleotide-binding universal stress UspA family protein
MEDLIHRSPDPAYRSVLVPLDGSSGAVGVMPTAQALAARFGATIHTVTVSATGRREPAIRTYAANALGTDPDDPRIHHTTGTDVAEAVRQCAAELEASVVCLATHARGRVAGTLLGATAREIAAGGPSPVVAAGPFVTHPDPDDDVTTPPLHADHLVACVDGTPESELGLPVAAAWAHTLGMKLTILTVAEPCPPPLRIGAPWRRHHGPDEDADEYVRRLGEQWALDAPGLETSVVYDPIGPGSGLKDYLESHPTGLIAVTTRSRNALGRALIGSGAVEILRISTAPALVVPFGTEHAR